MDKGVGASVPDRALSPSATEPVPVSAHSGDDPSRGAAALIERLRNAGDEIGGWGGGNEAFTVFRAADLLTIYHHALMSIVSWHADARDVFPDWRTTAGALADMADRALSGEEWLIDESAEAVERQQIIEWLTHPDQPVRYRGLAVRISRREHHRDSDEHRDGEDREDGLSGEAMQARAEGIAKPSPESPTPSGTTEKRG